MRISDWSSDVCSSDRLGKDLPGRGQPVTVRHSDIHQYDVRTQCTHLLVRLDSRLGMPDDANLGVAGEKQFEPLPYHLLVVCNKDVYHALILRSEERRAGKEGVSTCRSRGSANT